MARQKAQYNTRDEIELAIEATRSRVYKSGYGYFDQKLINVLR